MRTSLLGALIVFALVLGGRAYGESRVAIRVTYISADAIYVDGGKNAGLARGDTLRVAGGARAVSRLIVVNLSSHSAACRALGASSVVEVGDLLVPVHPHAVSTDTKPVAVAQGVSEGTVTSWRHHMARENRVGGYITLQGRWQRDLTGVGTSWYQPGIAARLMVENIAGTGLAFRLRHLSRWSYRDYTLSGLIDEREWTNRLTEMALIYENPASRYEVAVGRVVSPYVRGIGYIDGGYVAVRVGRRYRFGVAGGTEPDASDSSFDPDTRKLGFFVSRGMDLNGRHRLATTVALSASYYRELVSREFLYLQNNYSYAGRLNLYQSVEIDVNRQWRRDLAGSRVSFANFYLTSSLIVSRLMTLDGSIDARKNVRNYYTMEMPDSLFDDSTNRGVNGGVTLSPMRYVTLRGRAGIRYRGEGGDVQFLSANLHVRRFIVPGYYLTARVSRSKTDFTTAWAPLATLHFPLGRHMRLGLGGGAYLYDTAGLADNNYYVDARFDRPVGTRYGLSAFGREYFGGTLQSVELNLEFGINL